MISAEEFVAILEQKDLLPADLLAGLRQKIGESRLSTATPNQPVTAARLAKWLVDNGHLSRLLAQRLLAQTQDQPKAAASPARPPAAPKEPALPPKEPAPSSEDTDGSDLDFAPLEKEPPPRPAKPKKEPPAQPAKPRKRDPGTKSSKTPAKPRLVQPMTRTPATPDAGQSAESLDALVDASASVPGTSGPLDSAPSKKGLRGLFGGRKGKRPSGKKENVWDSTLLLVGGGALMLLLVAGGVLIWHNLRQSGDEMLKAANDFYDQGSYINAIGNYDRYLEKFPKHHDRGLAKVRRGLARLRQATEETSNWPKALTAANEVLGEITSEKEYPTEGRPEMAALLPKIAEGLANQARAKQAPDLVEKTKEALALVDRYVLSSSRPTTQLQEVRGTLALAEWEIARSEELNKATTAMAAAVGRGETREAYRIRSALLKQYPRLADDTKLHEAVLAASRAEQLAVRMVSEKKGGETADIPPSVQNVVTLATRRSIQPVPQTEGQVVFALAEGAAYGLEAATGKVLWRRDVGLDTRASGPSFAPIPIDEKPGSDALLVDYRHNAILRVKATTGQLAWRHPIAEPFDADPVVTAGRVLVATRSGRMIWIDLESGDSPGYVQMGQNLLVSPCVDLARSKIYQVAEHSNLFVLSSSDGQALQTVYLGHQQGSVTVPPVIVSRFMVIAENDQSTGGRLRVLALDAPKAKPAKAASTEADASAEEPVEKPPVRVLGQEIRLNGSVNTLLFVAGVRLLVVTDNADIHVYNINATDPDAPLSELAHGKAAEGVHVAAAGAPSAGMIRFPMIIDSQVWIADSQLNRYDLQASRSSLKPKGIENEGSVTLQLPVPIGRTVMHVRAKIGLPGVLVSAMPLDGGKPAWETHLAVPLVSEPTVDATAGTITAFSATGTVFQLTADQVPGHPVIDQPVTMPTIPVSRPVTDLVSLDGGLTGLATVGGPKLIPIFDPKQTQRFRQVSLPDVLGYRPIGFLGGLLAPCQSNQVVLVDLKPGRKQLGPFQPRLESGVDVAWRAIAPIGADEFLLADGANKLYRIGVKQQPEPHLTKLAEVDLAESVVSPMAVLDTVAYMVDATDSLLAFELPGLTRGEVLPLTGRCVWGPRRVGDRVFLATDDDRLLCLDAKQTPLWKIDLPHGPLAGTPLAVPDGYLLASVGGMVWHIEAATGNQTAQRDTGHALATGPVPLGSRLLIGGHDGSLYVVDKP